jgi:hypothetical protein
VPQFTLAYYEYHRLIGYYYELFGAANVIVLPFELFREQPAEFVARVCRFTSVRPAPDSLASLPYAARENPGMGPLAVGVARRLHRLFARTEFSPAPLLPLPGVTHATANALALRCERFAPSFLRRRADARARSAVASVVGDRYRASNDLTSRLIGIDLAHYGYARTSGEQGAEEKTVRRAA